MNEIKSIKSTLTSEIDINEWNIFLSNKDILKDFDFNKKYLCSGYFTNFEREHPINNKADKIDKNAYNEVLEKFYQGNYEIKFLAQHETQSTPIGMVVGLKKEEKGIRFLAWGYREAKDDKEQKYSDLIQDKLLDVSFGYAVENANELKENDILVRNINKIKDVFEISLVSFPRHKKSKIDGFKSETDIQEETKNEKSCGMTTRIRRALMKAESISSNEADNFIKNYLSNRNKNNNYSIQELEKFKSDIEILQNEIKQLHNQIKEISQIEIKTNNIDEIDSMLEDYNKKDYDMLEDIIRI